MVVYIYLKNKPFKEEKGIVYFNGFILHYDEYLAVEYETETIVTMDIDFYLDLLLLKNKYNKRYTLLNISNEIKKVYGKIHINTGKLSGQDKNGEFKVLEKL